MKDYIQVAQHAPWLVDTSGKQWHNTDALNLLIAAQAKKERESIKQYATADFPCVESWEREQEEQAAINSLIDWTKDLEGY